MVHALFRLPNAGCCCTLHNSFDGTNTVLRPGESREGEGRKKKRRQGRNLLQARGLAGRNSNGRVVIASARVVICHRRED